MSILDETRHFKRNARLAVAVCVALFMCAYLFAESERGRREFTEAVSALNVFLERTVKDMKRSTELGWYVWDVAYEAVKSGDVDLLLAHAKETESIMRVSGTRIYGPGGELVLEYGTVFGKDPEKTPLFRDTEGGLHGVFSFPVRDSEWNESGYSAEITFDMTSVESMFEPFLKNMPFFELLSREEYERTRPDSTPIFSDTYYAKVPSAFDILRRNIRAVHPVLFLLFGLGLLSMKLLDLLYERSGAESKLRALASALEVRESYASGHALKTAEYADALAVELGLSMSRRRKLRTAALFHDIGKLAVPTEILNKPDKLTEEETAIMQRHPAAGADLIRGTLGDFETEGIVAAHHENWDGSGYPSGISGKKIPLEARILAVADALEAATSDRSYRSAKSSEEAYSEIEALSGKKFDPEAASVIRKVPTDRD